MAVCSQPSHDDSQCLLFPCLILSPDLKFEVKTKTKSIRTTWSLHCALLIDHHYFLKGRKCKWKPLTNRFNICKNLETGTVINIAGTWAKMWSRWSKWPWLSSDLLDFVGLFLVFFSLRWACVIFWVIKHTHKNIWNFRSCIYMMDMTHIFTIYMSYFRIHSLSTYQSKKQTGNL